MLFLFLKEARASVDALCLSKKKTQTEVWKPILNKIDWTFLTLNYLGMPKMRKTFMFVHFLSALKTKYLLIKIFFSFQSLSCFYQNLSSPRKSLVTF